MRRTRRSLIALVAAYALALQALFAAFTAPAFALAAGEAAFAICQGGADTGSTPAPGHSEHDSCSACLAGHCAGGSADRVASIIAWPPSSAAVASVAPGAARLAAAPLDGLHAARAPPAA